ncbi:MAG TPA: MFS transporter [Thermoplasmata archaeon]|nr:MFS transporter [Thermoplasmata archaeon]
MNRAVRTFGYGFTGVLLGIYLFFLGGGPEAVVASLGISLATGAGLNVLVGLYADRFGRRRAMVLFGLLMAAAGLFLGLAPNFPMAVGALALGATSPTGTEVSPFLSVEQSIVAEVARSGRRTRAFALYNLLGSLGAAAGALASGVPTLLLGTVPTTPDPLRPMFFLYSVLGFLAAGIATQLPADVEIGLAQDRVPLSQASRTRVARISGLFAVDSFAGGFVIQSFVSFWFFTTYPESREVLGVVFFAAGILTAFSFLVAARLGERFGLLETMVFTHVPSNVLLILVPFAPGFVPALALYLGRMALSQMDVPTRQAFLAGIVDREERTAANAATNTARNISQAAGPFSSGAVVSALGLAAPFFIGGGLKILYDVSIYAAFRRVEPTDV